ncbi:hypothetical protein [Hyphomicrobium sp. ghe19]|uniref:hypothetical protein n=1 Tax=Hyphomicrobium sp. ghe19 TaxID=2682968 RepID=UPI001366B333|nr:hypothetical protein HYPP_02457 [Hyphomicrobium sp. ghe19]
MSALPAEPMIYPQRNVASLIAERLTTYKGKKHGVVQLPQGYQVVPITVCPDYMPPAKPKPVITTSKPVSVVGLKEGEVLFEFDLVGEGITYITVFHNGKQMAFGKSTLLGWEKKDGNKIALKMSAAVAKKRGLVSELKSL